jgi:hypothetical protein
VRYQTKNPSYYRARAADCENAAHDVATTEAERVILLRAAAQWRRLADELTPPNQEGRDGESCGVAETLRRMLGDIRTEAVRRRVLELINELEAQAKELDNGDAG